MATASEVLKIARAEVGYDRYSDPARGTKYGRWYEKEVDGPGGYDYGANGVAYCAIFVSWVLDQAKVECDGTPGAYCPSIHHKQTLKAPQLKAGDLALFDWEDDGTDDHIGIVISNDTKAKTIRTIEGNTNGGKVAERVRAYSTICGGIRPKYGSVPAAAEPVAKAVTRELVVAVADGRYGNGDARSKKLKAEGYDPEAVRLAVNAYLRGESFGASKPAGDKAVKYKVLPAAGLNIRSDHSINAKRVGGYSKDATPTVTKTYKDGSDTWGKTNMGWIALNYGGKEYARKV
ncbi:CHAP domain-containing protein [Eggerthellaceae bacterium 24-137]